MAGGRSPREIKSPDVACRSYRKVDEEDAKPEGDLLEDKPVELSSNRVFARVMLMIFLVVSVGMVLFNKWLYVPGGGNFNYPLTLMLVHQSSLLLMTVVLRFLPTALRIQVMPGLGVAWSRRDWLRTFLPIGLFQAATLACGNLAISAGSVHMALMVKAIKPVICYLLNSVFRKQRFQMYRVKILGFISAGVLVTIQGDLTTSFAAICVNLAATSTDGIRLILTQGSMQDKKLDPFTTLHYVSPVTIICVLPVAMFFEVVDNMPPFHVVAPALGLSTLMALLLNVTSVVVLGQTDAVVMVLAGMIKDVVLIFVSSWLFSSPVTGMQLGGYALALAGMQVYNMCSTHHETFEIYGVVCGLLRIYFPRHVASEGAEDATEIECGIPDSDTPPRE